MKNRLARSFRRFSVASVVIVALVMVITLLLGAFGIVNYLSARSREEAKLRHNLSLDADQFSAALALPIWNFDRAQIDKVIESMMQDRNISGVVVKLSDLKGTTIGRERNAAGTPLVVDHDLAPDGMLVAQRKITFSTNSVGSLKLYVTTRYLQEELKQTLVNTVLNICALDLVLVVSLYLLLWRRVLKPLQELEAFAQAVSSGNQRTVPPNSGVYQGELESLRACMKKMVALLEARYAALRQHESMLVSVLNAVPQSIFWKDRDSVYLGCNKVFATSVGFPDPEAVVGKTDFQLSCTKEDAETYRADDQDVMKRAQPKTHFVESAKLANGSRIWVDVSKIPLMDEHGKTYGVLGVYEDITDRMRAEEALGRQLAFDEIIQSQLARFASSTGPQIDELIQDSLQEMARFIGANLAYVGQFSEDRKTWSATHEWCAPGIPKRIYRYQNVTTARWNTQKIMAGESVRIERFEDIPPEATAVREVWEQEGFRSVFQVPLRGLGDQIIGSVGLVSIGHEAVWRENDMQRLRMVSDAIANVLERHRTEDDLRRSETRYRTLFEAAGDAIFINRGEIMIDCNPKALEMFGCTREQIVGQSPVKFSPQNQPDGRPSAQLAREKIQAALAGEPQHFEWRHCRLDGTEFDAEVNLNRIDIDHQSLMLGIVRDITRRKKAEAAVRASEAKFSTAFRASPDPMSIVELATSRIVDTNQVFERAFGWRRDEAIGASAVELGLWDVPEHRQQFLAQLEREGSVRDFPMIAKMRGGRRYDCLVSAELAEINGQKSMILVSQDITERKTMENALRLSEDRFRSAMYHSPIGMALLAPDGRWLEVNPALCKIIGYTRDELLATDFQAITHPDDLGEDLNAVRRLLSRDIETYQSEKRYLHKDGHAIWIQMHVSLVWNPDGTQRNFVCQIQDITERKQAEQRLQRSRLQLRALSARLQSLREEERTHLAREIHDHLGQLLTALKLDLRAIERRVAALGDDETRANLNAKLISARELTDETIKSIQQIASELRPAILDRLGLEAAIEAETQAFQSRTGIICEASIAENVVTIAPDQATAVFRIFQEILTNVARHAHAGHVNVRLSRENGSVALEVTDDGVGIKESDFENPKSLGLLGMQERAEMLGGHLLFGSSEGKGTTVTMRIPLGEKAEAAP